jgi:2-isopropylmalate synthase
VQPTEYYALTGLQVTCGLSGLPTATVKLRGPDGREQVSAQVGSGPVDAAFKAIDAIVRARVQLNEFLVQAVTEGIDALGEVSVRIATDSARAHGYGADTDIVVASVRAYLAALNRALESEAPARARAAGGQA